MSLESLQDLEIVSAFDTGGVASLSHRLMSLRDGNHDAITHTSTD